MKSFVVSDESYIVLFLIEQFAIKNHLIIIPIEAVLTRRTAKFRIKKGFGGIKDF